MKTTAFAAALILSAATLALPAFGQVASCTGQPDGTACTDGDPCTYGEVCLTELCEGGWPITCSSDACATRVCNGTATCTVLSSAPDGASCDDGSACTSGDTCKAGGCAGMLVDDGLRVERLAPGSATAKITWNVPAGATRSDVVRGLLNCLPLSPSGVCETPLVRSQNTSVSLDAAVPAPGAGYWYLARGRTACGAASWGFEETHGLATLPRVSNGGCVPNANASPRYVNNGLTVTDLTDCFEWEKKSNAPGVNDVASDQYFVGVFEGGGAFVPNGTAYTVFLATLNKGRFTRHSDWRLPSEEGRNSPFTGPEELESILLSSPLCELYPCIDPIFGPTAPYWYWSSSYREGDFYPFFGVWAVSFNSGEVSFNAYTSDPNFRPFVRAVRGGP